MSVCVCTLMHGAPSYLAAGRETACSVLENSRFDFFAACGSGDQLDLPASRRVSAHRLSPVPPAGDRARRFLRKFEALSACLAAGSHEWIVLVDADAVLARTLTERRLRRAIGAAGFGMVEQKGIRGSSMDRGAFLDHYARHTLAFLAPGAVPPAVGDFRYYNAGVVIGARWAWEAFVPWALETMSARGEHQVGEHMIADQDYLQYWANNLHPGSCVELPWHWNHCEWWDDGFPRPGVLFAHFSNFCHGPAPATLARMQRLRSGRRRPLHRLLGLWHDRAFPRERCTRRSSS